MAKLVHLSLFMSKNLVYRTQVDRYPVVGRIWIIRFPTLITFLFANRHYNHTVHIHVSFCGWNFFPLLFFLFPYPLVFPGEQNLGNWVVLSIHFFLRYISFTFAQFHRFKLFRHFFPCFLFFCCLAPFCTFISHS